MAEMVRWPFLVPPRGRAATVARFSLRIFRAAFIFRLQNGGHGSLRKADAFSAQSDAWDAPFGGKAQNVAWADVVFPREVFRVDEMTFSSGLQGSVFDETHISKFLTRRPLDRSFHRPT